MSQTDTVPVQARQQAGEGLGHYCATHIFDEQCERDPMVCRAFCGVSLAGEGWNEDEPECIVCGEMLDARGDVDLIR